MFFVISQKSGKDKFHHEAGWLTEDDAKRYSEYLLKNEKADIVCCIAVYDIAEKNKTDYLTGKPIWKQANPHDVFLDSV